MTKPLNTLFIMCDQLRWDYLSCYGHPHLHTPNIDRLAQRGVRFDRAYVQSPICGPARVSMYTGRYVSSHGSTLNFTAPAPTERFLGDYLGELGARTALVGKTHINADHETMRLLGIDPASEAGQRIVHGAFEPYWRDSGLHPNDERSENIEYNRYLRNLGYEGKNPWHTHANGAIDEAGHFRSGWFNENVKYPANIKEEHSETPYATSRAMEFIENASDQPWCLHLSYIKPHWPYIAPAPYHNMYGLEHIIPLNRDETEKENPHPVLGAFQKHLAAEGFSTTEMQEAVIPVYMGLIKQIDDQIGRLLDFLEARGDLDNTFIVFTSDHGDYLGDHWLGDKDFFHEESVRVPLIVVDPRSEADATRGTVETRLVESIDYVPTFVDVMGGTPSHRLEGHSLIPLLHGHENVTWRDYVISEVDFSDRQANNFLDLPPVQCRTVMVRTESWKYIAFNGFRPMLFDLENDPQELQDLGADPACEQIRQDMQANLADWSLQRHTQVSLSHQVFEERKWQYHREKIGVYIGFWSEDDLPDTVKQSKSQ